MFKIDIEIAEINLFNHIDEAGLMEKLTNLIEQLGVNIMSRVAELESVLSSIAASIDGVKAAVSAESAEVKTRIDELIAQIGGVTPGTVMTDAKLDEILVTANAVKASAEGLTKAIQDIFIPGGATPPVPGTLAKDLDENFIAVNGDIVKADGTVRYVFADFTTDSAGHHFDLFGALILPTSIP